MRGLKDAGFLSHVFLRSIELCKTLSLRNIHFINGYHFYHLSQVAHCRLIDVQYYDPGRHLSG